MRYVRLIVFTMLLFSCEKEKVESSVSNPPISQSGMLVLCEGLFQQNNTSLSWINLEDGTVENQYFLNQNGRLLGDTGNDMVEYGDKVYIVVNVSSTIEILDKKTLKSIKQIEMISNGVPKSPRNIKFHDGYGYITCFDGYVDVLDTNKLTITTRIKVGENPEDLTFANGKMYVSNSGGLNAPDVDSTVSVINIITNEELKKITVGPNPGGIVTDSDGEVYVISRGNYGSVPSRMLRLNSISDEVEETFPFNTSGITKIENNFLIRYSDFNTLSSSINLFDPSSETVVQSDFIDMNQFTTLYGLYYDSINEKIVATDAMNYTNSGYVKVFNNLGVFEKSYHVGLNPNSIVFYE